MYNSMYKIRQYWITVIPSPPNSPVLMVFWKNYKKYLLWNSSLKETQLWFLSSPWRISCRKHLHPFDSLIFHFFICYFIGCVYVNMKPVYFEIKYYVIKMTYCASIYQINNWKYLTVFLGNICNYLKKRLFINLTLDKIIK